MTDLMEENSTHLSNYARFESEANGSGPAWLNRLRKAGIDRFDEVGFPTTRQEEWRQTNVAPIARTPFKLAGQNGGGAAARETAGEFSFGADAAAELVFVNGRFSPELSRADRLPRGVRVGSLADGIEADTAGIEPHLARHADVTQNPFVALNTGFLRDGAFVHFARGASLERPVHLLFVSTPTAEPAVSHPRVLVL